MMLPRWPVFPDTIEALGDVPLARPGESFDVLYWVGCWGLYDDRNARTTRAVLKVLKHYGCTFDDVIVENVFTTDMERFLEAASYRASIYTKNFPTGTWLEVKGLALPEFMIEIELEAHRSR